MAAPRANPLPPSRTNPKAAKLLGLDSASTTTTTNSNGDPSDPARTPSGTTRKLAATASVTSGGAGGGGAGGAAAGYAANANGSATGPGGPPIVASAGSGALNRGPGSAAGGNAAAASAAAGPAPLQALGSMFAPSKDDKTPYVLPPTPKRAPEGQRSAPPGGSGSGSGGRPDLKIDTHRTPGASPGSRGGGMPPPSPKLLHQISDFSLGGSGSAASAAAAAAAAAAGGAAGDEEQRLYFAGDRHLMYRDEKGHFKGKRPRPILHEWKHDRSSRTVHCALVACLNIGVDPPDQVKPIPCARLECWIDPESMPAPKALETIGNALQTQYERLQPRAKYKQCLDPTNNDVMRLCKSLRKTAKMERILFHYNGHGVPKPTANGEIWVFNKNYTQYIPLSVYDLQSWMGTPSIYVLDCSAAGIVVDAFVHYTNQKLAEYKVSFRIAMLSTGFALALPCFGALNP